MVETKIGWKMVTNIKITAFDLEGNIKDIQEIKNLITTVGLNEMRDFLHGQPAGAADATEANKLHDADGGFTARDVGKWLHNTTDDTWTTVSGFVDSGELDLTDDIMADTEDYILYPASAGIRYVELGTGDTAPALADVALDTYLFRKIMTSTSKPADGQTRRTVYIAPGEAVDALEEIGWWAGAAAAAGEATGILISRVLYSRNKTALESLQIERTDTITEA